MGCAAFGDGVEVALPKGDVTDGVVRVGDTVRRPRQPQSAFVAAYLGHLERVGFDRRAAVPRRRRPRPGRARLRRRRRARAPRPRPGPARTRWWPVSAGWSATCTTRPPGWEPPPELPWFGRDRRGPELPAELAALPGPPELVAHCDVTPQNVVFRAGRPVALVDFDLARPTRRVADLLTTAMWWVPLHGPGRPGAGPARRRRAGAVRGCCSTRTGCPGRSGPSCSTWPTGCGGAAGCSCGTTPRTLGGGWARMWAEGVGDVIDRRRAWIARSARRCRWPPRVSIRGRDRRRRAAAGAAAAAGRRPAPGRRRAAGPLEPAQPARPAVGAPGRGRQLLPLRRPPGRPGRARRRWPPPRRPPTPSWRSPPCSATAT